MLTKGKILKAIGWTTIAVGVYIVYLGNEADGDNATIDLDNVIDAEFTVLED